MKKMFSIGAALLLLLGESATAWAAHGYGHGRGYGHGYGHGQGYGHVRLYGGIVIDPFFGPWYPPSAYYYPPYAPPVLVAPAPPPVYIEQGSGSVSLPASPQAAYWYYCRTSNSYYPYARDCPEAWVKVAPQPPNQP